MRKILLIGGGSFLAIKLTEQLEKAGYSVVSTSREKQKKNSVFLDLLDVDFQTPLFDEEFSWVVICAAVTSMGVCELRPKESLQVNFNAPIAIARHYSQKNIPTLFLSSDAVFMANDASIDIDALHDPAGEYGRQKSKLENSFKEEAILGAICRFGKILSSDSPLIMEWKKKLISGQSVNAFSDYYMAPISIEFATDILLRIIQNGGRGSYQASSQNTISYFNLLKKMAAYMVQDPKLVCNETYIDKIGKGAPNRDRLTLDTSRIEEELELVPEKIDHLICKLCD